MKPPADMCFASMSAAAMTNSVHDCLTSAIFRPPRPILTAPLRSALVFLKLGVMSTYWERTIQGAFILAAILLDHFGRRDRRQSAMVAGAAA